MIQFSDLRVEACGQLPALWEREVAEVLVVGVIVNKAVGARDILPVRESSS